MLWIECQRRIIRRKRTRRITYIRKRTPAINMSPDVLWIERKKRVKNC